MESTHLPLRKAKLPSGQLFMVVIGDITSMTVDVIVNAANHQLEHGGGVAGAIARHGGEQIQAESRQWVRENGPVSHDSPAYTSAGNLPCKYVIHAVGPVWGEGQEEEKLDASIRGALDRADELKLKSIAFPAISTGIFGFPLERAAGIIYRGIGRYFSENPGSTIAEIYLVLYDQSTIDAFLAVWDRGE